MKIMNLRETNEFTNGAVEKVRILSNMYILVVMTAVVLLVSAENASAHCDTLDGPVVADARTALMQGEVSPVLKWVSKSEEEGIQTAFRQTMEVRKLGNEARDLADRYFFEMLVRIHRAGEGAPYTGLKPGSTVDPAVALADRAIAGGSVEKLATVLGDALKKKLHHQFEAVMDAGSRADISVEAGREYVESYVEFTHFAEGVHGLIKGAGHHAEHN